MITKLALLYGYDALPRYKALARQYKSIFGGNAWFYSAPGRTEIIGNHTDHNGGKVLAGSIEQDTVCAAGASGNNTVTLYSAGYGKPFTVDLSCLDILPEERGTTNALIRGIACRLKILGYKTGGFNACVQSNVASGSGLSSSASIEILICTVFSHLFNNGDIGLTDMARISQWAENNYFGKPCGLMDQMACACGSMISIDFAADAAVSKVDFDFASHGYTPVICNVRQDHADLTEEYAGIIGDMKAVAAFYGKPLLCGVDEQAFYADIPTLRKTTSDRAVLRAMHFFDENKRVEQGTQALRQGNLPAFFAAVNASGVSSGDCLQNLFVSGSKVQGIPLALKLARSFLGGDGAVRIHGGGFGGTVLAFVPTAKLTAYLSLMNGVFGENAAVPMAIRAHCADKVHICTDDILA